MLISRFHLTICLLASTAFGASAFCAETYPNKPVRIITSDVGSGSDFAARIIAQELGTALNQSVIVDNRSSNLVGSVAAKAQPDGYTLLVEGVSLWISPLLQAMQYDIVKDFSPVTAMAATPWCLVVHPSLKAGSVTDLIALAKARPGTINYASAGAGGGAHLAAELFKQMAGVDIVHVPFKGSGAAAIGLIGGQVQMMFANPPAVIPHIKTGKLRAVAVTSAKPSALFPGLPTVTSSGLPGYEVTVTTALFAPARTPAAIIDVLNQDAVRALRKPDISERFFNSGVEVVGSTPAELASTVRSDLAKWSKVIKAAGIRTD